MVTNSNISPEKFYQNFKFDILILSGGDDLIFKTNSSIYKKRDEVEKRFLEFSLEKNIPVIGICRGMQLINIFFGGSLNLLRDNTHVNKHHIINIRTKIKSIFPEDKFLVNSFHKYVITKQNVSNDLIPFMFAQDKTIEAFMHKKYQIIGVMFHPERSFNNKIIFNFFKINFYNYALNFLKERK